MTREEEITMAADAASQYESPSFFEAFVTGAKWADEHPKQIEIPVEDIEELAKEVIPDDWVKRQDTLWEMIRRNQRAQFIDKACKWLKNYSHIYVSETTGDLCEDGLINAFCNAMKEGE